MSDLNEAVENAGKEAVSAGGGIVLGMGAVAGAGELGLSAVGLSTGLATLGLGSMFCGVGVVALVGIVGYKVIRGALD